VTKSSPYAIDFLGVVPSCPETAGPVGWRPEPAATDMFANEAGRQQMTTTAAEDDLRALFGQSTALFAAFAGPAHLVQTANPAFFAVVGRTGLAPAPRSWS
jgi:hypothetical protein